MQIVQNTPPINPSSNVVHLSDICVASKLYDSQGHSLGIYLLWQTYGAFNTPISESNKLWIGTDYAYDNQTNNDYISTMKVISNPQTGIDEIIVLKAGGEVDIYSFNKDAQAVEKSTTYSIHLSSSGIYHCIGYILDVSSNQTVLPIVYFDTNQWYLQIAGTDISNPLGWSDVGDVLGISIGQYELDQRIYFWLRSKNGTSSQSIVDQTFYNSKIISYQVQDFLKNKTNSLELLLPSMVTLDKYSPSVDMISIKYDPNSNDEQILIRYFSNNQNIYMIQTTTTDKGEQLELKSSISFECALASIGSQKFIVIQRPTTNYILVPYFLGSGIESYLNVRCFSFDWDTSSFKDYGQKAFKISEIQSGHNNALVYSVGSFYRLVDPTHMDIKFFIKAIPPKIGIHISSIYLIETKISFDDGGIVWESHDLNLEALPSWCQANDAINIGPNIVHYGEHMLQSFQCDFVGDSIVYGIPKLFQNIDFGQILGLYQVPPFENKISTSSPQLTISFMDGETKVNNVSTHANSFKTVNDNLSITVFGQTISAQVNATWSDSKIQMQSNHYSTNVHTTLSVNKNDILYANANQYNIWKYPLKQISTSQENLAEITIIQPILDNTLGLYSVQDKDFAYDQDYEIGMLLSYLNATMDGFSDDALLFHPVSLPILGNRGMASLSYNQSQSTMQGETITQNVSLSAGGSLSLQAGGQGTFWNIHDTLSYHQGKSEGSTNTTDMTLSKGFGLTFTFGNVNDDIYQYEVTPLVYTDNTLKIVRTKYKINLTGMAWEKYFALPAPVLFRLFPFTQDVLAQGYTRSIRFKPIDGNDKATVSVLIFNNSLNGCLDITCTVYEGLPKVSPKGLVVDDKTMNKLGEFGQFSLEPAKSCEFDLQGLEVANNTQITVQLSSSTSLGIRDIYWGCYPYSNLGKLSEVYSLRFD